ncbi:MAG: hypothetical protein JRC60_05445 [Deltaproteobacteria bacterium]|nr:hypothetical protein [Deltaproteobacteria bacterium]
MLRQKSIVSVIVPAWVCGVFAYSLSRGDFPGVIILAKWYSERLRSLQNVQICSSSRKVRILTTGIYWIFRELKFETDAEIGQKATLCKGLRLRVGHVSGVLLINVATTGKGGGEI